MDGNIHSREIKKTLLFFNGKYMSYGLNYWIETVSFRVFKKRLRIQRNIVKNNYQLKAAHPCKDNICNRLCQRQLILSYRRFKT